MKDVYDLTKYLVVLQTARLLLQPIGSVLFVFLFKKDTCVYKVKCSLNGFG